MDSKRKNMMMANQLNLQFIQQMKSLEDYVLAPKQQMRFTNLFQNLKIMEQLGPTSIKVCQSGQIIFNKTVLGKSVKALRLDVPHKGCNFNHINVNKKFFGLKTDPHIWLPPGTSTILGPVAKGVNKVIQYSDIIQACLVTAMLANSGYSDYNNGSTRNTAETATSLAGITASMFAVGKVGSAAWWLLGGGMVPMVVVPVASVYGIYKMSKAIDGRVREYFDSKSYGFKEYRCKRCGMSGRIKAYQGETHACILGMIHDFHAEFKDYAK